MKRDNEFINDDLIDLGDVLVETKGPDDLGQPDQVIPRSFDTGLSDF